MPRCAAQYFGTASVDGDIVFNAYASDAFRIHARFDRNCVSRFQAPRLPLCDPGVLVYFQAQTVTRSEEHTSELQSQSNLVCRLLLEKKKKATTLSPEIQRLHASLL